MPYGKSNKSIQDSAFKLRSGNMIPFKQMGSSPVKQDYQEALEHWKKYKAAKIQDKAVDKLLTDKNISKVDFEKKLAKITKTVDPYPNVKSKATKSIKKVLKKGGKFLGGKALGVASFFLGSMSASKADQPVKPPIKPMSKTEMKSVQTDISKIMAPKMKRK